MSSLVNDFMFGYRMGVFEGIMAAGMLLGTVLTSYLFDLGSYVTIYSIATVCFFLSLFFNLFVMVESRQFAKVGPRGSICGTNFASSFLFAGSERTRKPLLGPDFPGAGTNRIPSAGEELDGRYHPYHDHVGHRPIHRTRRRLRLLPVSTQKARLGHGALHVIQDGKGVVAHPRYCGERLHFAQNDENQRSTSHPTRFRNHVW